MPAGLIDLRKSAPGAGDTLEVPVTLAEPESVLHLLLPRGEAGRAVAVLDERSWAAKHYWRETTGGVTTYEFDGPLPAGPVLLRIPFRAE
jgi:hypothetical protein